VGIEDERIKEVNETMTIDEMIGKAVTEGDGRGVGVQRGEKDAEVDLETEPTADQIDPTDENPDETVEAHRDIEDKRTTKENCQNIDSVNNLEKKNKHKKQPTITTKNYKIVHYKLVLLLI